MDLQVKEICKRKGLTLKELASKLNVTSGALTLSLKGYPNTKTLENIARALQVPISALFEAESTNTIVCPHCGKSIHLHPSKEETITETAETAKPIVTK